MSKMQQIPLLLEQEDAPPVLPAQAQRAAINVIVDMLLQVLNPAATNEESNDEPNS